MSRYQWESAMRDMALSIAERAPDEAEFARLWADLGNVIRYLVSHDPRTPPPLDEADLMCPNCCTPWKCNGPHLNDQTPYALRGRL